MYTYDLTGYAQDLRAWLADYRIGPPGAYARHRRREGVDPSIADAYGCADAANILYTLGAFPAGEGERAAWVEQLQSLQDPSTGVFPNAVHSDFHTTAHCVAALELFDARPRHPLTFMDRLRDLQELGDFMESRDWDHPWPASHDLAGAASALIITGAADLTWLSLFIGWLDAEVDPATGMWRVGHILRPDVWPGLFGNLGGAFHYHFVYDYLRLPWPYPEKVIDTALLLLHDSAGSFIETDLGFKDADLVFCLSRARRQSDHRFDEVSAALELLVDRAAALLADGEYVSSPAFDDVHSAFGGLCAVAELQRAVPGSIWTGTPLRLVLDRRPFI